MGNRHSDDKAKVLSIDISCCERCPEILREKLLKMPGVYSVNINVEKNLVFVEGPVDPMTLLNKVAKLNKSVQLLPNNIHQDCNRGPTKGGRKGQNEEPHKCEAYEPPKVDERVCRDFFCKIHPRSRSIVDKVSSGHDSLFGGLAFFGFGTHPTEGYPPMFGYDRPPVGVRRRFRFH
ncbi:Heavy metal transport/detoxification superfamily protein [Striga hermonthica]|uniref:Heavy metal transport/detoxification superfamily protein n=1 Tax=Striga hermonthica TaxID=68872 RepID=A0A9N7RCA0_STRHE|nr:Heavy metal transport/detoxification superfamily protein [Striga hermonthica]